MSNDTHKKLGLMGVSLLAGVGLTLAVQSNLQMGHTAEAADKVAIEPPQSWTADGLNAMELDALPEIDWITVESGSLVNSETEIFKGDNIVAVWEGGPAKLVFDAPSAYDEFVVVLKGELVLSDMGGNTVTYKPGDMFMLPKGFEGTWEMTSEYRELIVVDTAAYTEE